MPVSGWNDPASPPPDDTDVIVLLKRVIHARSIFPATFSSDQYGGGWRVDVSTGCWATACQVEEHRFDWKKLVIGWLPLPGLDGVIRSSAG